MGGGVERGSEGEAEAERERGTSLSTWKEPLSQPRGTGASLPSPSLNLVRECQ